MKNTSLKARSAARLFAVQALFQMESAKQSAEVVIAEFKFYRFGEAFDNYEMMRGDEKFFETLVLQAVRYQAFLDQLADKALVEGWPIARIDPTIRAIFRIAGAEFILNKTPRKSALSEYIDIAKAFFETGKEAGFINGVLDTMSKEINIDGDYS